MLTMVKTKSNSVCICGMVMPLFSVAMCKPRRGGAKTEKLARTRSQLPQLPQPGIRRIDMVRKVKAAGAAGEQCLAMPRLIWQSTLDSCDDISSLPQTEGNGQAELGT